MTAISERERLMAELPTSLSVAIVDASDEAASLANAIRLNPGVSQVSAFHDADSAFDAITVKSINAIFIDLFTIGVRQGEQFIGRTREAHPMVVFCLFSRPENLLELPGVSSEGRARFANHYYQFPKTAELNLLQLDSILFRLSTWVLAAEAKSQLAQMRLDLDNTGIEAAAVHKVQDAITAAERALDAKANLRELDWHNAFPGLNLEHAEQMVRSTLKDTTSAMKTMYRVNIAVLVFGGIVLLLSLLIGARTGQWQSMAFGGFGAAAVVASLIVNPLKSIALSATRLVQVQVAYMGFLGNYTMLRAETQTPAMDRSLRLGDEVQRTLKMLHDYVQGT